MEGSRWNGRGTVQIIPLNHENAEVAGLMEDVEESLTVEPGLYKRFISASPELP